MAWFVHGVSYIDERLMMRSVYDPLLGRSGGPIDGVRAIWKSRTIRDSCYYTIHRMYNKRALVANTGAIVESYSYDPYGRPLIRGCAGAGDMTGDSVVESEDWDRFVDASNCNIFDPRADLDGDGVVGFPDDALFDVKAGIWDGSGPSPVRMARSLVGNPYMFQGRPNFIFDTDMSGEAADAELTLNDHRNRFADPMTGRWLTRDPLSAFVRGRSLFEFLGGNPEGRFDAYGLVDYGPDVTTKLPLTDDPDCFGKCVSVLLAAEQPNCMQNPGCSLKVGGACKGWCKVELDGQGRPKQPPPQPPSPPPGKKPCDESKDDDPCKRSPPTRLRGVSCKSGACDYYKQLADCGDPYGAEAYHYCMGGKGVSSFGGISVPVFWIDCDSPVDNCIRSCLLNHEGSDCKGSHGLDECRMRAHWSCYANCILTGGG